MKTDLEKLGQFGIKLESRLKRLDLHDLKTKKSIRSYAFDNNENIIGLNLFNCKISDISFLMKLSNLKWLNLSSNKISDISTLKDLPKLKGLCLSYNLIYDISTLKDLPNLEWLDLSFNYVDDISTLKALPNLTHLNLSNNKIINISTLKYLPNLTYLNLCSNRIVDISILNHLPKLRWLFLVTNKISDISMLKGLLNLKQLDLRDNQLEILPAQILELDLDIRWDSGDGILLANNPFDSFLAEKIKKGREAVIEYFKSFEGKRQKVDEFRVFLLGNIGAGKTSLVEQLLKKKFDENEPHKHDINIIDGETEVRNNKIKIHFWDFGGQEIKHSIFQFFLSKRSLYILVLDGETEENVEYWLKIVERFGGDSPIFVVLNKIDENPGFEVNRKLLQDKYKNIKGFYRVSCANKQGIYEFPDFLTEELVKNKHLKTTWAKNWFNVKKKLKEMNSSCIPFYIYETICKDENIILRSSQETLLKSLNDLGVIQHFRDSNLSDALILKPKWLTNAMYKIINSKELAKNKGVLRQSLLEKILEFEKRDDLVNPQQKFRYIIDLMLKFELCYEIDEQTVLIHELLEVQEPQLDFDYTRSLKVLFEYKFLPKSVIPRFIVKMYKDIKEDLRWQTGVVLENKASGVTAIIKANQQEHKINIWVNGKLKREYLSAIRNVINEINKKYEKLQVVEKIPCNCSQCVKNPEFYEYSYLIRRQKNGKDSVECPRSIEDVSIQDLLSGITPGVAIVHDRKQENIYKDKEIELEKRREIKNVNTNKDYSCLSSKLYELWEMASQDEKEGNLSEAFKKYEKIIDVYEHYLKAWEGLERYYNTKIDSENRAYATGKINILKGIIDFEINAESKIILDQLEINNLYFFENFKWNFQSGINILLGKNGYGKTLLLRLLISLLQKERNMFNELFHLGDAKAFTKLSLKRNHESKAINRTKTAFNASIGQIPVLAIPDSRYMNKAKSTVGRIDSAYTDIRQFGAYHFLTEEPYEDMLQNFLYQLCIDYGFTKEKQDSSLFKLIQKIVNELTGSAFEIKNIKPAGKAEFKIEVLTEGNNEDNLLPIQKSSQGTLSVLSIFGQIYNFLKSIDPDIPNNELLNQHAIVFIDELDAHLHPAWQQKIIKLLRDNFPNVQFVVTAYNPLIVAGCFEDEVAVLRKGKEGGFYVKQFENDFIGYEAKDLYQIIFEIEEKDETYLEYFALHPFEEEILSNIRELENIQKIREPSENEKMTLKKLNNDLKYIEKSKKAFDRRFQILKLETENRKLKAENKRLEKKLNSILK